MSQIALSVDPRPSHPASETTGTGQRSRVGSRQKARRRQRMSRILAGLTIASTLAGLFFLTPAPSDHGQRLLVPPNGAWIETLPSRPIFSLAGGEFARPSVFYRARRHEPGGGRIDQMGFGQMGDDKASFLRLTIYRMGEEPHVQIPFFVEMARRAAEAQIAIARSQPAQPQATRFGTFDIAEVVLTDDMHQRSCLGFRSAIEEKNLRLSGLACGASAQKFDQQDLACALDQLTMVNSSEEKNLVSFFAAPQRTKECLDRRPVATKGRR